MSRKVFTMSLLVVAVVLCVHPALGFELTVLHVNDSHSYLDATHDKLKPEGKSTYVKIGAWSRLETAVSDVRGEVENVALLHAGDAVQGDLYFMKYGGKPEMEFLNRLGFSAMTLGNHEFDKGPDFLAGFLKFARIPVVSANMDASAVPALAKQVTPYTVVDFGGEKVGIIGLTTKDTAFTSSPGLVLFADEAKAAAKFIKELEAQGVNKIVLLTHVGLEADKKIAASVPGVDVIVGGHSHTLLGDPAALGELGRIPVDVYPVVVKGADGNDVYVVTAWKWGRVLGRLDVAFDEAGHVTEVEGKPILLLADTFRRKNSDKKKVELKGAEREELFALIKKNPIAEVVVKDGPSEIYLAPYREGVEAMRNDVIGKAVESLPHIRVPGVDDSGRNLPHGSLIAPVVCESMLSKMASTGEQADIAFLNGGGVRESVTQGKITVGTAYTLMPFNNSLILLEMTGAEVKTALETGVTRGGGAFPYVGGARYTADMNRPEGDRIVSGAVRDAKGRWQSLEAGRTYRVVTNAYLAGGGDGYDVMKQVDKKYDTGFVDAVAFIEYVTSMKNVLPITAAGVTYIPAQ